MILEMKETSMHRIILARKMVVMKVFTFLSIINIVTEYVSIGFTKIGMKLTVKMMKYGQWSPCDNLTSRQCQMC